VLVLWCVLGGAAVLGLGYKLRPRPGRALPKPGPPPENRAESVRRILKHLQRKTIAELAEGTAGVVVGVVRARPDVDPMLAPVSGRPCLGYHLEIYSTQFDAHWKFRQLCDEAPCVAFEVEDATGRIGVDAADLELAITDGVGTLYYPPLPPAIGDRVPFAHMAVTVEEGLLLDGARVLVCGLVARDTSATDYRDGQTKLMLRASATFPLVASTDPDLMTPGKRPIDPKELYGRGA